MPVLRCGIINPLCLPIWSKLLLQILCEIQDSASSLTLQFSCVVVSSQALYKTCKVYFAAIQLEQGFSDPTNYEILCLVCKGIRWLQGDSHLPVTINLLLTLKIQLFRFTSYTILEQYLLWATFSQASYGFMRVSEFTSPTNSEFSPPGLHWCDMQLNSSSILHMLHQSKADPLWKGQCITITATNTSIALYMPYTAISTLYLKLTNLAHSSMVVDLFLFPKLI